MVLFGNEMNIVPEKCLKKIVSLFTYEYKSFMFVNIVGFLTV